MPIAREAQRAQSISRGAMKVSCGNRFEIVTKDQKQLVALTQWHMEDAHQKQASEADVVGMSKHQ
ncbi:MAG: hypothetical protein WAN74_01520 [Thermoplasmata archaeon]